MDSPTELSFHGMEPSPSVESQVRERVEKLQRYFGRINSCRVVIEMPHRHGRKGKLYRVRIEIGVPGKSKVVVSRDPGLNRAHEDIHVAVRDAFDSAQRLLKGHSDKRSGAVKHHEPPLHGAVQRLESQQGFGFVALPDGQEVYFHRNAVIGGAWNTLRVGDEVRLSVAETESEKGPQATTVTAIGKHHIVEQRPRK